MKPTGKIVKLHLNDQNSPFVDKKSYTASGVFPSKKGKATEIRCPFCTDQVTSPVTKLVGPGQACKCGALFGTHGLAIRLKEEPLL